METEVAGSNGAENTESTCFNLDHDVNLKRGKGGCGNQTLIMQGLIKTMFPVSSEIIFKVALRGETLLTSPQWNKGTAFTKQERKAFGLIGRLPSRVNTIDEQCDRAYDQLHSHDTPIGKNSFLQSLKEQNWVLYYSLLSRHLTELTPIIYTPTEVSLSLDLQFSSI